MSATPCGPPCAGRAAAPYIAPGDHPMSVLVLGGSQGAKILSDVVPAGLAALPDDLRRHIRVAHQARPEDVERVLAAYGEAGIRATVRPFFEDVATRMADAQLVVSRSAPRRSPTSPRSGGRRSSCPSRRRRATTSARTPGPFVAAGAALLIPESRLTPESLAEQARLILTEPAGASRMARAAASVAAPDAAERLADLIESLTERT